MAGFKEIFDELDTIKEPKEEELKFDYTLADN